jgi:hypothetical protein
MPLLARYRLPRVLALSAFSALALGSGGARAEETSAAIPCAMSGTNAIAKDVRIYDAPVGGKIIASFTGAVLALSVSEVPIELGTVRAKIATTEKGTPSLRIDGYALLGDLPLFTSKDVSVYSEHVWISGGQEVRASRATPSGLSIERTLLGSNGQKVKATAACEALTLAPVTPTPFEPEGNARGYMMKSSKLDLFDHPNGDVVLALDMVEGGSQLFWSSEQKLGFVRVVTKGDLVIDAWARPKDLSPLKKGELVDSLVPPRRVVSGAQLAFGSGAPRLVKMTKEAPIRALRDEKDKPIGAVEVGAEVYVMETVAGYTHVLPKHLGLTPPDGQGFWMAATDVPSP